MRRTRALKIMAGILAVYAALWLPALFSPDYLDTPLGVAAALPVLSVYVFHALGVPGLLMHDGLCGWGWCAPSWFGWLFLALFWGGLLWLVARLLARLGP
jgi:hypothetical protein